MMANKMKELDMKETSSKSLLSNVLDMDDDFRSTTLPTSAPVHHPSHVTGHQNAGFVRSVCSNIENLSTRFKTFQFPETPMVSKRFSAWMKGIINYLLCRGQRSG